MIIFHGEKTFSIFAGLPLAVQWMVLCRSRGGTASTSPAASHSRSTPNFAGDHVATRQKSWVRFTAAAKEDGGSGDHSVSGFGGQWTANGSGRCGHGRL